ncbi:Uncharacterised protein [Mycoplasmopsis gallopavonis]|uniref:Uncharacterized protein n=1 Tax=Mycoplasmopsis gallopavonis TaxID=76629 RepID=A0A449AYM6_9BACT|nr:hypothetical protein [Mycoplasmopsis gallopavonis]VEU72546.1 Uncharacterised protein [Mycoplasmopsis gallopavonis]
MNKKPRKPGTGRSRKVKEQDINWDIFTREDLIEIAKRYREITKDKFKTEKVQEASHISIVSQYPNIKETILLLGYGRHLKAL